MYEIHQLFILNINIHFARKLTCACLYRGQPFLLKIRSRTQGASETFIRKMLWIHSSKMKFYMTFLILLHTTDKTSHAGCVKYKTSNLQMMNCTTTTYSYLLSTHTFLTKLVYLAFLNGRRDELSLHTGLQKYDNLFAKR